MLNAVGGEVGLDMGPGKLPQRHAKFMHEIIQPPTSDEAQHTATRSPLPRK